MRGPSVSPVSHGSHALALRRLRRHVTHARDARGEQQQAVGRLRVAVHVPQARDERAAIRIDALRTRRDLQGAVRADRADRIALDQHAAAGLHRARFGVEEVCVLDEERALRHLPQALGLRAAQRVQLLVLRGQEFGRDRLPACGHERDPAVDAREKFALRVEPDPDRLVAEAIQRHETHRRRRIAVLHRALFQHFGARLTRRQQRDRFRGCG